MSGIEQSVHDQTPSASAVVVIAVSMGGLAPLRSLVRGLTPGYPAALVIAQHVWKQTLLPEILRNDTRLPVKLAAPAERLEAGTIYVCPAQRHIIVNPDATLSLSCREHVNFCRPNADWLFRSAAASYGTRAVAVVLSGRHNDGSRGVVDIGLAGGLVIAQTPDTCVARDMPCAAIATGFVDLVLAPSSIAAALTRFVSADTVYHETAEWEGPFLN